MPVAITGATGRLGRALLHELGRRQVPALAWSRPDYDLDDPGAVVPLIARNRPGLLIHAAAWTDTEGCASNPDLAVRRNGTAVAELARACVRAGTALVLISTNEVFDGERSDGAGYTEDDPPNPINPYGASKLMGEREAMRAFAAAGAETSLTIVRTAWLYGPPGNDFPTKILAAARKVAPREALKVVADEVGSPTFTLDLAAGIVELIDGAQTGTYHLANGGRASRLDTARLVLGRCLPDVPLQPISRTAFVRASEPPAWAVLDCARAASQGVRLRPWEEALGAYARQLCS